MVASYEKGSIIKKNGDTINCFVPISIYYSNSIKYRMDKNSTDIKLKTTEIKSIITPYNRIENLMIDNKEYIMRLLVVGKAKLYSQNIPDEGRNPNGGYYTYSAPTIIYSISLDSAYYLIEKKNYIQKLSECLKDCPTVQENILNKSYKYEDMEKIINEYNICK
jgi:hypothetical protein